MSEHGLEEATSAVQVDAGSVATVSGAARDPAALQRAGFVRVQETELRDLAVIGEHVEHKGVLHVCRGKAIVHQQQLNMMIHALSRAILGIEQKPKKTKSDLAAMTQLSRSLAYLSAQVISSQRLMLEAENIVPQDSSPDSRPAVKAFAPGSFVVPGPDSAFPKCAKG